MENNEISKIRRIRDGGWFWMEKEVVQDYAQKIGPRGIAVYALLASMADKDQRCFPSQKYIAEKLGCSRTTINKTIKVLETIGLVRKSKKDRCRCAYQLLRCEAQETQVSTGGNLPVSGIDTNDNTITRINNNDIDIKKNSECSFKKPETKEDVLALDLAVGLNDIKGLKFYLSVSRKYPECLLRRLLGEVRKIPEGKIKKGRGALFNHLLQMHAKERNNGPGY